jgi:hypothetical protein
MKFEGAANQVRLLEPTTPELREGLTKGWAGCPHPLKSGKATSPYLSFI